MRSPLVPALLQVSTKLGKVELDPLKSEILLEEKNRLLMRMNFLNSKRAEYWKMIEKRQE
uniref:Uncharacterized protein n=1 Tax=Salix viminalis TaxID=40686 RepID=A0A6N2LI47_SALVM